jgi:uncharacterized surface protein with fasciclin (FAS1) repeats
MMIGCTGGSSQFPDRPTCMTACAAYPVTGNNGLTSGDNQECRQYHVMNTKRVDDPVVHCPHAGKDGGGVCVASSVVTAPAPAPAPAPSAPSIVALAQTVPTLSTLVSVLTSADYKPVLDALSGPGPFTVFAPNNAAFTAAGIDLSNVAAVTAVLQYHVISGAVRSSALPASQTVRTLQGADVLVTKEYSSVTFRDEVMVGGAKVVSGDNIASNGVVHVIDTVMTLPASATIAPVATPTAAPVSWSTHMHTHKCIRTHTHAYALRS